MKGAPPGERWYQIATSRKPNSDFDKIGCTIFVKHTTWNLMEMAGGDRDEPPHTTTTNTNTTMAWFLGGGLQYYLGYLYVPNT